MKKNVLRNESHTYKDKLSISEYKRLVEWMKNSVRKPAINAFTAGACRDAARAFEDYIIYVNQKISLNEYDLIQFLSGWGINQAAKLGKEICKRYGIINKPSEIEIMAEIHRAVEGIGSQNAFKIANAIIKLIEKNDS